MPSIFTQIKKHLPLTLVILGIGFYFVDFPIPQFLFRSISTLGFLIFVVSLVGFGSCFIFQRYFKSFSLFEKLLFSFVVGSGFFGLAMTVLGIFNLWTSSILWLLVTAGWLCFIRFVLVFHYDSSFTMNQSIWLTISPTFLILFITSWIPISYYDSLVYHLALPNLYRLQHGWVGVPELIYSSFPQAIEILWTACLLLWNDTWINLLGTTFCLTLFGLLFTFSKRFLTTSIGKKAFILTAFMPTLLLLSRGGYVDLPLALFTFAAFYAYSVWKETQSIPTLILSGLLAGLALSTKYTGGIVVIILGIFVAWDSFKQRDSFLKNISLFSTSSFLMFLPWFIKNIYYVGNPVFPFLYKWGIAEKNPWIGEGASGYFQMLVEYESRSWLGLLKLPWDLIVNGQQFAGGADILGAYGWAPLFLLLFLSIRTSWPHVLKRIALFSVLFFIVWGKNRPVLRFLIPLVPFLAIWAAWGWDRYEQSSAWRSRVLKLGVGGLILSNLFTVYYFTSVLDVWDVIAGYELPQTHLSQKLDYYPAAQFINQYTPRNSSVMIFGDQRSYYIERPLIVAPVFHAHPLTTYLEQKPSQEEIHHFFSQRGITHLLINDRERQRLKNYHTFELSGEAEKQLATFLSDHAKLLYKDYACRVYGLTQ